MTLFRSFLFAPPSIHLGIYMSAFGEMDIAGAGRGNRVTNAIAMASRQTGVDFNYLFNQAKIESRSEEHTSDLHSLMRISYAVFCLNTKYLLLFFLHFYFFFFFFFS